MRRASVLFALVIATTLRAQGGAPTLTKKLTIGCESCGDASQFGSIQDVTVSANGDVLVTDKDVPLFRRFDVSGKPTWNGGRRGKGPGEFTLPIRSAITPTGFVVIDMQ